MREKQYSGDYWEFCGYYDEPPISHHMEESVHVRVEPTADELKTTMRLLCDHIRSGMWVSDELWRLACDQCGFPGR